MTEQLELVGRRAVATGATGAVGAAVVARLVAAGGTVRTVWRGPTMTEHDVIQRYFDLAADPDLEAYVDQFTDDAVVEDEDRYHRGVEAIRAWRATTPPVAYTLRRVEGATAVVEIAGDFPGSPVDLAFGFVVDGGQIRALTIRPAE